MELITIKWDENSKKQFENAVKAFSEDKVGIALQRTLNDVGRKAKTEVRRGIQKIYTVKSARIMNESKEKGLSIKFANRDDLTVELRAGHIPVSLSEFNVQTKFETATYKSGSTAYLSRKNKKGKTTYTKSKRSISSVSVQIFRDNAAKLIATAFIPGVAKNHITGMQAATPAIFARGKRGKPRFQFATGKERYPIGTLTGVSVATMAMNAKTQKLYKDDLSEYANNRVQYHLNKLYENI